MAASLLSSRYLTSFKGGGNAFKQLIVYLCALKARNNNLKPRDV
jgi:hypothetical protein